MRWLVVETTPALELIDVKKTYSDGFAAVKGINLRVEKGDFFALLGPNGAGKSTTIGMISSLVRKTSGKIFINGIDCDTNFSEAKMHLGLVPQEFNFNLFETCFNIVRNQAGFFNLPRKEASERALHYLDQLGLIDKKDKQARSLSGGMKRRLMIARAIAHEPELLILDEPTAGVDLEIRRSMWQFLETLNKQGTTIILTTHYLEEAESMCRNVAIINHGLMVHESSMKSLLAELDEETFVLDIKPTSVDSGAIKGFDVRQVDETTLEAKVPRKMGLNELFAELSAQGVVVTSLRNKINRLEELFLRLIQD